MTLSTLAYKGQDEQDGCPNLPTGMRRPSQAQSEELRRREAVRAQLDQISQDYKQAQEQARSALKQLK